MKIKLSSYLAILIILSGLLACQKKDKCPETSEINGEWVWVKSIGGFGGFILTPESEGRTERLIIDECIYQQYINDSLALEAQYELGISEDALLGTEENTYIQLSNDNKEAVEITGDELRLTEQCYDCFTHIYQKN